MEMCTQKAHRFDHGELTVRPGDLDGITILRYAHIGRSRVSGGVEQYLRHLDRALLHRHRLTILQTYLAESDTDSSTTSEKVGRGTIHWLPLFTREAESRIQDFPRRLMYLYRRTLEDCRKREQGHCFAARSWGRSVCRHRGGHFRYKTLVFSDYLSSALESHHVNLIALHWLGYDTNYLIHQAAKSAVPVVFINHFDNSRLQMVWRRKWLQAGIGIGVVSSRGLPPDLKAQCCNLSDAVDTEFFAPQLSLPLISTPDPMIFFPARVDVGKGHEDLIAAAALLHAQKKEFTICCAGAIESRPLLAQLLRAAAAAGLAQKILFVGEKNANEIRHLFQNSAMTVLPSHAEGLGRVLLEAQAMKKPVVAYDQGGMAEAMIPGETGMLVPAGDVEKLAASIKFLLENDRKRADMGERGREFVSTNFSMDALIHRHEAFYAQALRRTRHSR